MKDFLRDMLDQVWTGLGMFVAWLVLDGSAKTVTGYAIIATTLLWAATYPLRNPKDSDEEQIIQEDLSSLNYNKYVKPVYNQTC